MTTAVRLLLRTLLALLLAGIISLSIPRILSILAPGRIPQGYYAIAPTVAAVYLGLESETPKTFPAPDNILATHNIGYRSINGKSLCLDIYRPKNVNSSLPVILFIHGGGWSHGSRNEYLGYALHFAGKGYITATPSYRLTGDATYPACIEDITEAVDFLFRKAGDYGIDSTRVALAGGSAGAHLAMLAGYGWSRTTAVSDTAPPVKKHKIRAVADLYGPVDLTTPFARQNSMVTRLMACSWQNNPGLFRDASPIFHVTKNSPPTLILHGSSDKVVPAEQAEQLKQRLDSLGIPCELKILPGWPHTMDLVNRVHQWCTGTMESFFQKHLD